MIQAGDARLPVLFELRQQQIRPVDGLWVAGHALRTAVFPLGDELGAFQHSHVLLHGCKRHVVPGGQLGYRRIRIHDACEDVAPRAVGQGSEQQVQSSGRELLMCNHMVVYRITAAVAAA